MSSLEIVGIVLVAIAVAVALFVALLPWLIRPMFRLTLAAAVWTPRPRPGEHPEERAGGRGVEPRHVDRRPVPLPPACPRRGRILANAGFFTNPVLSLLARRVGIIPVPFTGPKAQRAAITAAREALDGGARSSRSCRRASSRATGFLGPFYRGLEVILKGFDDVPVVPAALDNLWGSIWSFQGGTTVRKRPVGLRRTVAHRLRPAAERPAEPLPDPARDPRGQCRCARAPRARTAPPRDDRPRPAPPRSSRAGPARRLGPRLRPGRRHPARAEAGDGRSPAPGGRAPRRRRLRSIVAGGVLRPPPGPGRGPAGLGGDGPERRSSIATGSSRWPESVLSNAKRPARRPAVRESVR